ncbi:unnamed protein product [Ceutorhynchus assimilis]|uniref:Uncharacterized protein n=1 Tax=Ceutorhynchus assimilis TaxID=467358 RepID=A0A9N9ML89_9CUCU|nr:unnamed protein product [Ceutorhynchus assimilis]
MLDDFNVHRKVREVTRKGHKNNCKPLVNEAGEIIIDAEKKKEAWRTHLENLFHDVRKEQKPTVGEGPEILVDEENPSVIMENNGRYVIAERSEMEQYMIGLSDRPFRPAWRQMTEENLVAFIHGRRVSNRQQYREEIVAFLGNITESGGAANNNGLLNPPEVEERTRRSNIEE